MPFKSKKQSSACFATGGFGGKVDCEEWANKTNYKSLPKKKFKEWLEENHKDFFDENWFGRIAAPLAVAGGLMGGMAQGATSPEAGNYTTLQKQDTTRFHPYSWRSGKPGESGTETPDWVAAKKNYEKHGKTFLKPEHDKIFMQHYLK